MDDKFNKKIFLGQSRSANKAITDAELFSIPDLPPIGAVRRSLVRAAVSGSGHRPVPPYVEYSLPVDKPRLAAAGSNCYRTDLRVSFQRPYYDDDHGVGFDEARFLALNRHHLRPNTAHTPNRTHLRSLLRTVKRERASLDE